MTLLPSSMQKAYPVDFKIRIVVILCGIGGMLLPFTPYILPVIRPSVKVTGTPNLVYWLVMGGFGLLAALVLLWAVRVRLITTPQGIEWVDFVTHRTTWNNIESVLVTPYGYTLVLEQPAVASNKVFGVLDLALAGDKRIPLMFHMWQWQHGGLEQDFKKYAPHLFEEKRFKIYA